MMEVYEENPSVQEIEESASPMNEQWDEFDVVRENKRNAIKSRKSRISPCVFLESQAVGSVSWPRSESSTACLVRSSWFPNCICRMMAAKPIPAFQEMTTDRPPFNRILLLSRLVSSTRNRHLRPSQNPCEGISPGRSPLHRPRNSFLPWPIALAVRNMRKTPVFVKC
jgi:hypothetical protein